MDWTRYYLNQAGGSVNYDYFRGNVYQKGYGLGGTFKKFFKWIIPIFNKHALPVVKSGLKSVGKEALSSVANIAKDVVAGEDIKNSASKNITGSINNIQQSLERKMEGRGVKRKYLVEKTINKKFKPNTNIKGNQKSKKFIILKKQNKEYLDIFD